MKRVDRTPLQKAIDDTMAAAMAIAHYMREKKPVPEALMRKFLNATQRVDRRK